MYCAIRTLTAKDMAAAIQFAGEVTAYLNKQYSLNMKFGVEMFGAQTIHWHLESDSADKIHRLSAKLMQDPEYLALLEKYRHTWLEGSIKDTLVAFA